MRAVMGLLFFPRGGSAQVARYLARSLPGGRLGRHDRLRLARRARASRRTPRRSSRAWTCARSTTRPRCDAPDPLAADPPFHPSFEDRPGAPDRVFARVGRRRLRAPGRRLGASAGGGGRRRRGRAPPAPPDADQRGGRARLPRRAAHRPPARHRAADAARDRRRAARGLGARGRVGRADAALGARLRAAARAVAGRGAAGAGPARGGPRPRRLGAQRVRPGGVRQPARPRTALAHWRRWLVEEPRGWDESGEPGSVSYSDEQLEPFEGGRVLLYVGRFTEVKRVPLLMRAHAARPRALRAPGAARAARRLSRASGRASTRSRSCARRATRTSSWPAGAGTRTCPTGSTPPTCSCCRRCASSSAR